MFQVFHTDSDPWGDKMSKPRKPGLVPSLPRSWLCFVNMPLSVQVREIFVTENIGKIVLEPSQVLEPTSWLLRTSFATYALLPYPF